MPNQPVAAVLTLGCKLNLADSEAIGRGLRARGFDVVDSLCRADAIVVNTCSVTHIADQKSRKLIRAARRTAPGATVAVTGCFPRSAGEDAATSIGADIVTGTRDADKEALIAFIADRAGRLRAIQVPATSRVRAFIKAQEGCNDVCAFCIVPRTRGREASRSIDTAVADVSAALADGACEVVITGTQLGAWGRDLAPALAPHQLIAALLERTEAPRIRFSSLQPQDITPELLALWQDPRLMPHFHLALQSGSDAVLSAMRRRYTAAEFRAAAARIRAAVPGVAITTDVIAGFPGETETDFEATLAFCREMGFARVHAFPYSQRSHTTAARMAGQLPRPIVKERMGRLLEVASDAADAFHAAAIGTVQAVLWESQRTADGLPAAFGHTASYIPVTMAGHALIGAITPVRLIAVAPGGVLAAPLSGSSL